MKPLTLVFTLLGIFVMIMSVIDYLSQIQPSGWDLFALLILLAVVWLPILIYGFSRSGPLAESISISILIAGGILLVLSYFSVRLGLENILRLFALQLVSGALVLMRFIHLKRNSQPQSTVK